MKYIKEFKQEALKLSDEIGVKKAASQLGIQYYTLVEWRKNRKAAAAKPTLSDDELRARERKVGTQTLTITIPRSAPICGAT